MADLSDPEVFKARLDAQQYGESAERTAAEARLLEMGAAAGQAVLRHPDPKILDIIEQILGYELNMKEFTEAVEATQQHADGSRQISESLAQSAQNSADKAASLVNDPAAEHQVAVVDNR